MNRLIFGSRKRLQAQRRTLFRRAAMGVWCIALAGAAFGLPGPSAAAQAIQDFLGGREAVVQQAGISTSESAESALRFRQGVFDARPAPKPSPTKASPAAEAAPNPPEVVAAAPTGSIQEIIYAAAAEFGLDGAYLVGVASCESGLNPGAVNAAGYHGLFQYDAATWGEYGYGSIYDPVAQARTTAMLISQGQSSRWPNCA